MISLHRLIVGLACLKYIRTFNGLSLTRLAMVPSLLGFCREWFMYVHETWRQPVISFKTGEDLGFISVALVLLLRETPTFRSN